tara:strand:- start:56 stop:718 length:663 start_codon:yes stop_codon:yes gene_type:complete
MPKRSETSLGNMDGLKSYEPETGWSDIPNSELNKNADEEKLEEDAKSDNWQINEEENDLRIKKASSEREDFFEEDFIEDIQETKMSNLARQVAETNTLVDKALGSLSSESTERGGSKTLDELGESLGDLFGELYEGSAASGSSPWGTISDGLAELSAQIDKRDTLRQELKETQQSIDKTRLNLIEEIQDVANSEQERLSMIKMRSRLATVMADKLLNKLR